MFRTSCVHHQEDNLYMQFLWYFFMHLCKQYDQPRGLVVSLTTNYEVPGSIPRPTVGNFPEGEDSRGDHGLGRLVEFRFKGSPGTTSTT